MLLATSGVVAFACDALNVCVCVGSSAIDTVCACSPPRSPRVKLLPSCIGVLPRRSGSAKLTRPSPPNVVPSKENRAWFWLIGNSCPLHSAQPLGAKSKLIILISDRNGSATLSLLCVGLTLRVFLLRRRQRAGRRAAGEAAPAAGDVVRRVDDRVARVVRLDEALDRRVIVGGTAVARHADRGAEPLAQPDVGGTGDVCPGRVVARDRS